MKTSRRTVRTDGGSVSANILKTTRQAGAAIIASVKVTDRGYPWRISDDSYVVCVSEILLQKTQANTAARVAGELFRRYPDWERLARARVGTLERLLRPLGFHRRRARGLWTLSRHVVAHGGALPTDIDQLERLPFVGPYVAASVLAVCHGITSPILDANVRRILSRIHGIEMAKDIRRDAVLKALAGALVDQPGEPASTNWAIIDFAHITCCARSPDCDACVLKAICLYARSIPASVEGDTYSP